MKRQRYGNAYRIEVGFIYENDEFSIFAGDGLAHCDLWADIAPSLIDDGDYIFVGIYLESHFNDEMVKLTGKREQEARKILEANKAWREWADDEVRSMTGYVPEAYDAARVM